MPNITDLPPLLNTSCRGDYPSIYLMAVISLQAFCSMSESCLSLYTKTSEVFHLPPPVCPLSHLDIVLMFSSLVCWQQCPPGPSDLRIGSREVVDNGGTTALVFCAQSFFPDSAYLKCGQSKAEKPETTFGSLTAKHMSLFESSFFCEWVSRWQLAFQIPVVTDTISHWGNAGMD